MADRYDERRVKLRQELDRINRLLERCAETEARCIPPARIGVVREVRDQLRRDREKVLTRLAVLE